MRISVLGSGSSGNCAYIATEQVAVLVDLGFGRRSLERRLRQVKLENKPIDAILVTHGHLDHVRGIPAFSSQCQVPIYMNEGTRNETRDLQNITRWETFQHNSVFFVGDLQVTPFTVSHDAAEPVGFRFSNNGICGALATDIGELNNTVTQQLADCDWLVLESNHDEEMVKIGPYPLHVKRRVLGNKGHLSNQELASFLADKFDRKAKHLFLAHISRQNNDPQIALESAQKALEEKKLPLLANSCTLHLTHQAKPSIVLDL